MYNKKTRVEGNLLAELWRYFKLHSHDDAGLASTCSGTHCLKTIRLTDYPKWTASS